MHYIFKKTPSSSRIGEGSLGGKSFWMLQGEEGIRKISLGFPTMFSYSPKAFEPILVKSKACYSSCPQEAEERLLAHHSMLTPMIEKGVLYTVRVGRTTSIMTRSDDSGAGTGYEESGGASVLSIWQFQQLVKQAKLQAIKVLSSGFSENALEFKRIKGIEGNSGVLLMPAYGERIFVGGEQYILPALSINYLGGFGRGDQQASTYIFSFGSGFGWAGSVAHISSRFLSATQENLASLKLNLQIGASYGKALNVATGAFEDIRALEERKERRFDQDKPSQIIDDYLFGRHIEKFLEMAGKFPHSSDAPYFEAVADRSFASGWVCVQFYSCKIPQVEMPAAKEKILEVNLGLQVDRNHKGIVGAGVRHFDKIRIAGGKSPSDADVDYNTRTKDYLLVINASRLNSLNDWTKRLKAFSNAASILVLADTLTDAYFTHLLGAIREIGIPVFIQMVSWIDDIGSAKDELPCRKRILEKFDDPGQFVSYVDEHAGKGFLGRI